MNIKYVPMDLEYEAGPNSSTVQILVGISRRCAAKLDSTDVNMSWNSRHTYASPPHAMDGSNPGFPCLNGITEVYASVPAHAVDDFLQRFRMTMCSLIDTGDKRRHLLVFDLLSSANFEVP
jgi:hypothetical protein